MPVAFAVLLPLIQAHSLVVLGVGVGVGVLPPELPPPPQAVRRREIERAKSVDRLNSAAGTAFTAG
jgi:hypothetical protein